MGSTCSGITLLVARQGVSMSRNDRLFLLSSSLSLMGVRMHRNIQGVNLSTSATFVRAEFSEDRFVQSGGEVVNVKGNSVPYAPEVLVSSELRLFSPFGIGLTIVGTYIGKQYGDVLNTQSGSLDGRSGSMQEHFVLDARASYDLPILEQASVSISVKNLLDERYIASRRPQGIRVGLPRFVTAGVDFSF